MFRFLVVAALFGLVFWLVNSSGRGGPERDEATQELVRDALTGVYFPKNLAVKVMRGGETLHFFNVENRDKFLSLNR
ncbi:MAG: hypothetical protein LBV21_04630 [Candidatus Adiutrix sp.]|jgi:hypothetical protein|nr:hypothetical protein [Candidatus Adiutrix sp.]